MKYLVRGISVQGTNNAAKASQRENRNYYSSM